MKTIVVTGATSSLGIAVIEACVRCDIMVLAFIHPGSINEKRMPVSKKIIKIYCSLSEMEHIDVGSLRADVMIHLAWAGTNPSARNLMKPQIDNIKYSLDAVSLAEKLGCGVFVGAGSQAEYGRKSERINENTRTDPTTAYGIAKYSAGLFTREACKRKGIRYIWPRIFSTYGPNTQDRTIINYTISSLLKGKSPSLTKCEQIWDFIYVDDAARALLLLADKGVDGEVYCVASGKSRSLREYMEVIEDQLSTNIPIGYGNISYNEHTVMHLEGDITKIQKLGFDPEVSFEAGIERTINWARGYYLSDEM